MLIESSFGWFVHGVVGEDAESNKETVCLLVKAQNIEEKNAMQLLGRLFELDGV